MNNSLKFILLTMWVLIGIMTACNLPSLPPSPESAATSVPTLLPTETAVSETLPSEVVPADTATPELAPLCESQGTPSPQCQTPIAEETSVFCTKKSPYNLLLMNDGATYEVLTPGFRCFNEGMKDDRQIVTCTGPMALHFEVRVCDPACAVPTVMVPVTQCPPGYAFNTLGGCCTQDLPLIQPNCVVLKLKTKSCVVNCAEFNKEKTCNNNSYACVWDADKKICRLRK